MIYVTNSNQLFIYVIINVYKLYPYEVLIYTITYMKI